MAFHPTDPNTLYVTLSGFDEQIAGQPGHVFKTVNASVAAPTWTNVSPPVNLPANTVVVDPSNPNVVYVGTDIGIWRSDNGGTSWAHMGAGIGMPNIAVFDLRINASKLVAFTHGRGAFVLANFDINNDSNVDCADVAVLRASLGKRFGDAGFNAAADLNSDGVVDVRDQALLTRQLPAGTTCP